MLDGASPIQLFDPASSTYTYLLVDESSREGGYVPFGPFLVGAGLAALILGPQTVQSAILGLFGL